MLSFQPLDETQDIDLSILLHDGAEVVPKPISSLRNIISGFSSRLPQMSKVFKLQYPHLYEISL